MTRRLIGTVFLLLLTPCLCLGADSSVTVRQLDGILAAARAKGSADEAITDKIAQINLKERLTPATLLRLSSGMGQRTAAALELLADRSALLDPPVDEIEAGAPPSADDLNAIIGRAQAYTLAFVKDLPNIVCSRVVSRFDDQGAGLPRQFRMGDTLTGELTVRDGAESFRVQHTGPADAKAGAHSLLPQFGLATSGEFGSIMAELFAGYATFAWRDWETVAAKRVAVIAYSVAQKNSRYEVSWRRQGRQPTAIQAAYRGEVSIDPASGAVLRIAEWAVDLPMNFPVRRAWTVIEYLPVKLAGSSYLLPARSLSYLDVLPPVQTQTWRPGAPESLAPPDHEHYLNRTEFREYRKFAAESGVAFDAEPDAPPAPAATPPAEPASRPPVSAPPAAGANLALPEAPPIVGPAAAVPALTVPSSAIPPAPLPQPTPRPIEEEPLADSQPIFRVRRNEIPVRVVVRDGRGDAVGGLRKGDFELFDEGKHQQISGFRMESRGAEGAPAGKAARTARGGPAPGGEPVPSQGRYVVLLFDDVRLGLEELHAMRAEAKRALKDIIGSGTRVALLTETGKQYLDFTDDAAKLDDVLSRIRPQIVPDDSMASSAFAWVNTPTQAAQQAGAGGGASKSQARFGVGATASQTPPGTAGYSPDSVAFGHTGDYSRYRSLLKGIEAAVNRLAIMPGDRSVLFVSPGFIVSADDQREYWELIDRAARKGIPISTLDARGLWTLPEFGAERTMVQDPTHESGRNTHESELRQGLFLRGLADGTGGVAVENGNDFDAGFKRIAMLPKFTYALTFSPLDLAFDGKYHKLKVEVREHRGVIVQARDGYLAADKEPTEAEQAAREIEDAIFSRDEMREIPLSVRVESAAKPARRSLTKLATVSTTMHVGLDAVRFASEAGRSRASLTATVGLFDSNGVYIGGKRDKLDLDYAAGKVPATVQVRGGFHAAPGPCFVRVVVRDQDGHMSSINRTVEVR